MSCACLRVPREAVGVPVIGGGNERRLTAHREHWGNEAIGGDSKQIEYNKEIFGLQTIISGKG
jgi:hypothetical protein